MSMKNGLRRKQSLLWRLNMWGNFG